MAYQTPQLLLLGSATGLVLGSKPPVSTVPFGDSLQVLLPRIPGNSRVTISV